MSNKGLVKIITWILCACFVPAVASASGVTTSVFGPKQYLRTTGPKDVYTASITVPTGLVNPFVLHVQNGASDGSHRVSSGTVQIDGIAILSQSDFNQQAASFERTITVKPGSVLRVVLASEPGSYLSVSITGVGSDVSAPLIDVTTTPAKGSYVRSAAPQIEIKYNDAPGSDGASASGVDTSSLQVLLDGEDRTGWFTVRSSDATADIPAAFSLADGDHNLKVTIKDKAGNKAEKTLSFKVDTVKPVIVLLSPTGPINRPNPTITLAYSDSRSGVDRNTFQVFVDGKDVSSNFAKGEDSASWTSNLDMGEHSISASIEDMAGNQGASNPNPVNVDTIPPEIKFSTPAKDLFTNSRKVGVNIVLSDQGSGIVWEKTHIYLQHEDDPELEITSTLNPTGSGATGTLGDEKPLVDGSYKLRVVVADAAGNTSTQSTNFAVDTIAPVVWLEIPAPNTSITSPTPQITVRFSEDNSGISRESLQISIDGKDVRPRFEIVGTSLVGQLLPEDLLRDGRHTLTITVSDRAGNQSTTINPSFLVDSVPPVVTATISPAPNAAGWNNTGVTVSFECSNSANDIAICSPPALVQAEGAEQVVTGVGVDNANGRTTQTVTVSIDKTTPTIAVSATAVGAPYTAGQWTNKPVVVTFECVDSLSGVETFTPPVTVATSGVDQSVTGTCTDKAGNSSSAKFSGINIETAPPSITAAAMAGSALYTPGEWTNQAVTVTFTCTNASGSPVTTVTPPVTISAEGQGQSVTGSCTDEAGNTATTSFDGINIDTTKPTILATPSPMPGSNGWYTSDVTVTYTCSDALSGISSCPSPKAVSAEGASQQVTASVSDRAGNTATSDLSLNIEKGIPTIAASVTPTPNAAGWNNSDVTVQFTCAPAVTAIASCPMPVLVSVEGKDQQVSGSVTDSAGKTASTSVVINLDKSPPTISSKVTPDPNAAGWNRSDVTVEFLCSDILSGMSVCPGPIAVTTEGAGQKINAEAIDQAGNKASTIVLLNVDKTPPTIHSNVSPSTNGAGWNNSNVTVSYTCNDELSGIGSCPNPSVVSTEGEGQSVSAEATDLAGNTAASAITLSIDRTPPSIVSISAPDQVSSTRVGQAVATISDNFTVDHVAFKLNGVVIANLTGAPYQIPLAVPANASIGETLTLTVEATDIAGNIASSSRGIKVSANGVVAGQVLADSTGLPLSDAVAQVLGSSGESDITDPHGKYVVPVTDTHVFVRITREVNAAEDDAPAMISLEREIDVHAGAGTIPVDARMTPLAEAVIVDNSGKNVNASVAYGAPGIAIAFPVGLFSGPTSVHVTALSSQGLPNLLPLGWSPISAFDLQANAVVPQGASVNFTHVPNIVLQLVKYDTSAHAWITIATNLTPASDGSLSVPLPSAGDYALVTADSDVEVTAVIGQQLRGIAAISVPTGITTSASLNPPVLPAGGGTAQADLRLQTPGALPSGTVVQSVVSESYLLRSGASVSQENRLQDLVLYRTDSTQGSALSAQFPITPSRTYKVAELISGKVHLDILAGREGVRGQVGGTFGVVAQSDDGSASITVAGGALDHDTAVSISNLPLDPSLPSSSLISPVTELYVDFSGKTLSTTAEISAAVAARVAPSDYLFIAQINRISGIPKPVVVSLAHISGNNVVSVQYPGLPGIVEGGQYVIYRSSEELGFVGGTATANGNPVGALVESDSLPFISLANAQGKYVLAVREGLANLSGSVLNTSLSGTASTQVTAGRTSLLNLSLVGALTTGTVTPSDGATAVSTSTQITIATSQPVNGNSADNSTIKLYQGEVSGNRTVAVNFVLLPGGTGLSIIPAQNLQPDTKFTLAVSGLADVYGAFVTVPLTSFTTKSNSAPQYDPSRISFSFPDQNGTVHVSAPAETLQPGTRVMIVDLTSGLVITFTAANDGSISGDFSATINDVLQITVTDPNGGVSSFSRSSFVAPDGSVSVGPGGGTIDGPEQTGLIVPAGAVDHGVVFKVVPFGADAFTDRPDIDGLQFGSGLKVQVQGTRQFNKELKLVFPKPANAPDNAEYYVFRRAKLEDGTIAYEVIDFATVQGTGDSLRVVTASPPFSGFIQAAEDTCDFILTYVVGVYDKLMSIGVIEGKVFSQSYLPGSTSTVLKGVKGARVHSRKPGVLAEDRKSIYATTQDDGQYVLWDGAFKGGTVTVFVDNVPRSLVPDDAPSVFEATAVEVPDRNLLSYTLRGFKSVASADVVLPPKPTSGAPSFSVTLLTRNGETLLTAPGILTIGTDVVVGVKATGTSVTKPTTLNTTLSLNGRGMSPVLNDQGGYDVTGECDVDSPCSPSTPGVYTVEVTVQNPFGGPPVVARESFRVVAGGESATTATPGIPPAVLSSLSFPKDGSSQVPVNVNPVVVFSEPVTIPQGSIQLQDSSGVMVPTLVSGMDTNGNAVPDVFKAGSETTFTSVTLLPLQALSYSSKSDASSGHYKLNLSSQIQDTNHPRLSLVPTTIHFSTYELPETTLGTDLFASPGIFVAGDRAYVAKLSTSLDRAEVWMYNVTDPLHPKDAVRASAGVILGRADDITGEAPSEIASNQTLIAVAQAPYALSGQGHQASNVYLYRGTPKTKDAGKDALDWIGVVSLTQGAMDGIVTSIDVKGDRLYAATLRKGIQVVDLKRVIDEFSVLKMPYIYQQINSEGAGWSQDAVLATIGVVGKADEEYLSQLAKIKVADYPDDNGVLRRMAVATGYIPAPKNGSDTPASFVVAASDTLKLVARVRLENRSGTTKWPGALVSGRSLALGKITRFTGVTPNVLDGAVVVGTGDALDESHSACGSCSVLAVVDMSDPESPSALSFIKLQNTPTDVLLKDNAAIVAYSDLAEYFDLTDPKAPRSIGVIAGLAGRLFDNGGTLFSSGAVPGDPGSPLGGIHVAEVGTATLLMDFNNDARINEELDLPLKGTNAVAFWSSDSADASDLPERENLLDYISVRLRLKAPVGENALAFRLLGSGNGFITDKIGTGLEYLQNDVISKQQADTIRNYCHLTPNMLNGECPLGATPQPLPYLDAGTKEFLIRCANCSKGPRTLQLGSLDSAGKFTILDEAALDIRPVKDWIRVYTVRSTPTPKTADDFRPLAVAQPIGEAVPGTAVDITIAVHGYNVSEQGAKDKFFPTYFKRLYWGGRPVLAAQSNAQFIGFSWPGDEGAEFGSLGPHAFFPEDEFHALESGAPLAALLDKLKDGGTDEAGSYRARKFNIMAHSLGNLVVNSAIQRTKATIDHYVMNEAAVPAEAMSADYIPNQEDVTSLLPGAVRYGYSTDPALLDKNWIDEWSQLSQGQPPTITKDKDGNITSGPYTDAYGWYQSVCTKDQLTSIDIINGRPPERCSISPYVSPLPRYDYRWRQLRPGGAEGVVPDSASSETEPQRGPWKGFFGANLRRTSILNTFNLGDMILNYPWFKKQQAQTPNTGALGLGDDNRSVHFWAALSIDKEGTEEKVFADRYNDHSNIVRQWSELAYWFKSLSGPMGLRGPASFPEATKLQFCNFSSYVPKLSLVDDIRSGATTHGYMHSQPYSKVQQPWEFVSRFMNAGSVSECEHHE